MSIFSCGPYSLSLEHPLLMGIVNLTPDSFSGDGCGANSHLAIEHARQQLNEGADILDVGAESSRPGALPVSEEEEMRRLRPVLREIAHWGVPISVDTYKPSVMTMALDEGAAMINDIAGLTHPQAIGVLAERNCGICIMHMQGAPDTMQQAPIYGNVVAEVQGFLADRVAACMEAGIAIDRLLLDPGFGFGKSMEHNFELFRALTAMNVNDLPWLVGVSRKSLLGGITGRAIGDRIPASIAAAMLAAQKGAKILRVHDVGATRDALAVLAAFK
jgi:dihydropteroate synthase